jgi:hypothetical protein
MMVAWRNILVWIREGGFIDPYHLTKEIQALLPNPIREEGLG